MTRETIECIIVANKAAERTGKFKLGRRFERVKYSANIKTTGEKNDPESWKKTIGKLGMMTVEDYEAGNYKPYGLTEKMVNETAEIDSLKKQLEEQQKANLELQAQLEEKKTAKPKTDK